MNMPNLTEIPRNLPEPEDDGLCDHLPGMSIPNISLPSTGSQPINLSVVKGCLVLYIYPMTGQPNKALPDGWDQIPGARGCTPQSCAFRDHYQELQHYKAEVFGLSVQSSEYQTEAAKRLHLPFLLLSDENYQFARAMNLPTFKVDDMELIKRITLICEDGEVKKVFYPVFPPDQNADQVLEWLRMHTF
ncbi:MAG: peroxiredoxin [Pseudomonadales bacterium]|nr:peroxiredoxin [Pseudomonadales bacterium]